MVKIENFKYGLDSVLNFEKFKGKTIEYVLNDDPNYILWCLENIKDFDLDEKADKYLDSELKDNHDDRDDYF